MSKQHSPRAAGDLWDGVCLRLAPLLLMLACPVASRAQPTQPPIQIVADLTEAPRKLYHAEIDLPVKTGPLTLITPQWIPGNHRPAGPVSEITGVVFTVRGQPLAWRRDDVNLFEFHLTIPAGVTSIHAHLDCIVTARATPKMAMLEWEDLMLYPAGIPVRDIPIQPSVIVPAGWDIGTALAPLGTAAAPITGQSGLLATTGIDEGARSIPPGSALARYAATTVEQLQDSPVLTGQYFHEYALAPEISPKHYLEVTADERQDAELRPELLASAANLVREGAAAFGPPHYNVYHFLLTLSDAAGSEGLEHGQSSDNGVAENGFHDAEHQLANADLLSHEFTHSWNGKYRRPAGLYQPDFATPQQGALLWVYEGLTQYMGHVLAARAGLETQQEYRDMLAISAANMDVKPGRAWRSTEDTAISSSILRINGAMWSNWRRSQDYYQDGELVWLDADTLIRQLTSDKKSLTDFFHLFLGKGGATGPLIVPYELPEIVADLNQIAPYDWMKFFQDRIMAIEPHADLDGITRGGYKLDYADKPSKGAQTLAASQRGSAPIDAWYSIGVRVTSDGMIGDVRWDSPGDKAKLTPGQKIYAINGVVFSGDALRDAVRDAKGKTEPIHLIVQNGNAVSFADVDYHGGERYPVLVRADGTPASLDEITKPLASAPPAPPPPAK